MEVLAPCTCADDNVNLKWMLKQFRRVRALVRYELRSYTGSKHNYYTRSIHSHHASHQH